MTTPEAGQESVNDQDHQVPNFNDNLPLLDHIFSAIDMEDVDYWMQDDSIHYIDLQDPATANSDSCQ